MVKILTKIIFYQMKVKIEQIFSKNRIELMKNVGIRKTILTLRIIIQKLFQTKKNICNICQH